MKAILVCGLARCGTSMVMKMLHRGGLEPYCDGNFSSYEHPALGGPQDFRVWLPKLSGKVAKVLDPHHSHWPNPVGANILWLDRDTREQAKSQVKFLKAVGVPVQGQAWRNIQRGLIADRFKALDLLVSAQADLLFLRFENLLQFPLMQADRIAQFLDLPSEAASAMADVVIRRSPRCAPNLDIEVAAMEAEAGL